MQYSIRRKAVRRRALAQGGTCRKTGMAMTDLRYLGSTCAASIGQLYQLNRFDVGYWGDGCKITIAPTCKE